MVENAGENPQVSVVRIRGRFSRDSHGHSHQDSQGDNALTRRFSAVSPRSHQDSHLSLTTTRVFRHGVTEKPAENTRHENHLAPGPERTENR